MRNLIIAATTGAVGASTFADQIFTDRASFEAALASLTIETFEGAEAWDDPNDEGLGRLTFEHFDVSTEPDAGKILDQPFAGAYNTTPGGAQYLYLDTDVGLVGSHAIFSFSTEMVAFGFDFTQMGESDNVFTADIDDQIFEIAAGAAIIDGFWGFISDDGSDFIELSISTTTDSGYGVDQVTFAVPAPGGSLALGSGACLFVTRRRRRADD